MQPPPTYTVGGSVSGMVGSGLVLKNSNGDTYTVLQNGSFAFALQLKSGASYQVAVSTPPMSHPPQYCSVANASGTVSSADVTNITVTCRGPFVISSFISSSNPYFGFVIYTMNVSTGALTPVAGSPFTTPGGSTSISPAGNAVYVAETNTEDIWAYAINPVTGALTAVPGSPFAGVMNTGSFSFAPSGKFAYATSNGNSISAYAVDTSTGALTALPGSPYPTAAGATPITFGPGGAFAYMDVTDGMWVYAVDATTGALTAVPGNPFAIPSGFLTFDPSGRFGYIVNVGVWAYTVNSTTGALTLVPGSPFATGPAPATGPGAIFGITIHPNGKFAYVAFQNGMFNNQQQPIPGSVYAYTIDTATGALTPVAGSPFVAGPYPLGVAIDPSGRFAFVVDLLVNSISAYEIDTTSGALEPTTVSACGGSTPIFLTIDPSGRFLYSADDGGPDTFSSISVCSIDSATGALTGVWNYMLAGANPGPLTFDIPP